MALDMMAGPAERDALAVKGSAKDGNPGAFSVAARPTATSPTGRLRGIWSRRVRLPLVRFVENWLLRKEVEKFYTVFGGHIMFQTLRAATQFDLFTKIAEHGSMTRQEIAQELKIGDQPARIMLLGLTVAGILKKRGERYTNARLTKQLLVSTSPKKVLAYVELQHAVMYRGVFHLYDSIREFRNVGLQEFCGEEPTLYQRLAHDPETEKVFQLAMQELSVQANKALAEYVDFSNVEHVIDVGGGDGTNALALVRRWPHLKVTVFDLPSVCDIAQMNIRAAGAESQIRTVAGNCFTDAFPSDADCILFSHFFTIWSPEKDQMLLKKCYDALPAGGKVLLYNMMQNDDESGPWGAAIGSPYFLAVATGEGMLYTWSEYESWMRGAGFDRVKRFQLPRHQGVIMCSKP